MNSAVTPSFLFLSIVASSAFADEEHVLTTGTTTPVQLHESVSTAHVLTQAEIERLAPVDLPNLLGRISGVNFRDSGGRGSVSNVFIRGVAPGGVLVLVDGVRSASATTGATALENIPVESIARIEVVKGPLSSLYGADAVGGVIQIFTKSGDDSRFTEKTDVSGSAFATVGSFSTVEAGGNVVVGNNKARVSLGVNFEDTDGFDRTSLKTGGNDDDDAYEEKSLNVAAVFNINQHHRVQFNYLFNDSEPEFDNVFGEDTGFFSENEIEQISLKWDGKLSEDFSASAVVGQYRDENNTPVFLSEIESTRTQVSSQIHYTGIEKNIFTLALDYYNDHVPNYEEEDRENKGIAILHQWNGERVRWVGSARHDDNEAYGSDANYNAAVSYNLLDTIWASVSYGTAFLAPNFNQLFFPGFANPNLLPQESESFEISVKGQLEEY